jgi:hypothetical protein
MKNRSNFKIADFYKKEVLAVLKKYPELKNTNIEFKERTVRTTMASRPKLSYLFLPKNKRKYLISINNKHEKHTGYNVRKIDKNISKGIFAHELGHIIDYKEYSNWEITKFGIKYLFSDNFKKIVERRVDRYAINHGFGRPLEKFAEKAFHSIEMPKKYQALKHKIYYYPTELLKLIKTYEKKKI